jgi:hypothetical protein
MTSLSPPHIYSNAASSLPRSPGMTSGSGRLSEASRESSLSQKRSSVNANCQITRRDPKGSVVTLVNVLEGIQKIEAVLVGLEDRLSLVASRGDMIYGASIFYSERPGHEGRISEGKRKVKHSIPDPKLF